MFPLVRTVRIPSQTTVGPGGCSWQLAAGSDGTEPRNLGCSGNGRSTLRDSSHNGAALDGTDPLERAVFPFFLCRF